MTSLAERFAANARLVIFVGSGVSSIPPTSLPSWWGMNRSVIVALADRAKDLIGAAQAQDLAHAITARQEASRFPPEYQAEVIVARLRESYFTVLQSLDSETPNDVHLRIAALAKSGCVPAVVTTNFDRALEAAFRQLDAPYEVWANAAEFGSVGSRWREEGSAGRPCPIIKLHGSVESPNTLVDTLSQRKRGFTPDVSACIRDLLRLDHWLFLGYSGGDLMADENYLFLKPDAAVAQGFTWLVRGEEAPVSAVSATRALYGGRAEIVHGELPGWLAGFSAPLLRHTVPAGATLTAEEAARVVKQANARVAEKAREWAASERFDRIALVFADLLTAVGEPAAGLEVLERLYEAQPPLERKSPYFGVVVDSLANAYSDADRLDEAIALFQDVIAIFAPLAEEEQHLGALNNLALVYQKQGRTKDALHVYEQVLAFAEEHDRQDVRGVALHNLGMVRTLLGEYDEAERLYKQELEIVQALGDEPARAHALNNLGDLEVSRRRFESARGYLGQALAIRDRIGDDLGAAQSRGNLANIDLFEGSYEAALELYQQNLLVFERFGNRSLALRTLSNIARIKENTGQRDEATNLLNEVLADPVARSAPSLRAQALQILGEIQQKEGEPRASVDTFKELLDLTASILDARVERDARAGLGIAFKDVGELEDAIAELRKAVLLTEDHSLDNLQWVTEHLADAMNKKGLEVQQEGDFAAALPLFFEALERWRKLGSPWNEGQTLRNIANTYAQQQQLAEAASVFEQSAAALLKGGDRTDADEVSMTAGQIYLVLGRLDDGGHIFREILARTEGLEERADSMNRMGQFAEQLLVGGEVNRGLWLFAALAEWNQQDGFPEDAAACFMNIALIRRQLGDTDEARHALNQAMSLLDHVPDSPLLAQARARLEELPDSA
ncbi:tetratricopeptide repeat protein [Microbacterium pumilum]|uniref:SIR2-like domain-containing protein n=1 Tax=Microbacterium pumilum TaxID=344165 RepID=A0ABN2RT26_9MICO